MRRGLRRPWAAKRGDFGCSPRSGGKQDLSSPERAGLSHMGEDGVELAAASMPAWFDGRALCVLLNLRGVGQSCWTVRVVFCRCVSFVPWGRTLALSHVSQSCAGRSRLIWRVEITLCTSVANMCSIAASESWRGEGERPHLRVFVPVSCGA